MPAPESPEPLLLIGGPLHQLGRRLGLVRGSNTVLLGLVLGVGLWLVIVVLAVAEGITDRLFEMSVVAAHARLLLVIPLFFVCESWIGPRTTAFIATIAATGVVPPAAKPALDAEVASTRRMVTSWWPEAVCLLVAIWLDVTGLRLQTYGVTGGYDSARSALAFQVYFHVGLTLFRFQLFRAAWRLAVWTWFLWRVSRLDLRLIPGHPDRAGGLGPLEGVHERLTPIVAALSILESASMAESISAGSVTMNAIYPWVAMLLLIDAVLFLGPMLVFTDKLWATRTKGVGQYMGFAARYVSEFEAKWIGNQVSASEHLLGTADIQSLADLNNAIDVVKKMRWITVSPRLLTMMMIAAVAPLAPLMLFEYPVTELAQKFFSRLVGF